MSTDTLYGYQVEDAAWLAEQFTAFLLSDMGTGKTIVTIRACDNANISTGIVVEPGQAITRLYRDLPEILDDLLRIFGSCARRIRCAFQLSVNSVGGIEPQQRCR